MKKVVLALLVNLIATLVPNDFARFLSGQVMHSEVRPNDSTMRVLVSPNLVCLDTVKWLRFSIDFPHGTQSWCPPNARWNTLN